MESIMLGEVANTLDQNPKGTGEIGMMGQLNLPCKMTVNRDKCKVLYLYKRI